MSTSVLQIIAATVSALVAAVGAIKLLLKFRWGVVLWTMLAAALVVSLLVGGRRSLLFMQVVSAVWCSSVYWRNTRQLRRKVVTRRYPFKRLRPMNRWLRAALATNVGAVLASSAGEDVVAFGLVLPSFLMHAMGALVGSRKRVQESISPDSDDWVAKFAHYLHFPSAWGRHGNRQLSKVGVVSFVLAIVVPFSLLSTRWDTVTDSVTSAAYEFFNPKPKQSGPAGGRNGDGPSITDAEPPVDCVERLRESLGEAGIEEVRATRIMRAWERFSWPLMGCDLLRAEATSNSVLVIINGPQGGSIVVDDGESAHASISVLFSEIEQFLESQVAPQGRITSLTFYRRAGLGPWQTMEIAADDGCRLVSAINSSGEGSVATPTETAALVTKARELEAFPFVRPGSALGERREVVYVAADQSSPTGYREMATEPLRPDEDVEPVPCSHVVDVLGPIADQIEVAARR